MSKFGKNHCKYFHMIYTTNISGPLFHTSRNPVLPPLVHRENYTEPDYLHCLRPAAVRISDAPTLAGEPRTHESHDHIENGIKPEVFQKWDQVPKVDIHKEWSEFSILLTIPF